jgi:hypothetical protein
MRLAPHLDSVFPIQGPPGAGKTHIGARMICTLTQTGKNIGVTSNSHKVIRNVLDEVLEAAPELGTSVQRIQKISEEEPDQPRLQFTTENAALLGAIGTSCQVAGGTSSYLDAPRGMEFPYSANRLNVATPRARAICVLVGSPTIFEVECRTPRQIHLANAFCRYLELAATI